MGDVHYVRRLIVTEADCPRAGASATLWELPEGQNSGFFEAAKSSVVFHSNLDESLLFCVWEPPGPLGGVRGPEHKES